MFAIGRYFKKVNHFSVVSLPYVLLFMTGIPVLSMAIYMPAAPFLDGYFNVSIGLIQISLNMGNIVGLLTGIPVGLWSDSVGRRRPMLLALFLLVAGSLCCAHSQSYALFIIGRIIQNLGASSIMLLSYAILADKYHGKTLAHYLALGGIFFPCTMIGSSITGAYLFKHYGWEADFYFTLFISFVLLVWLGIFLPETLADRSVKKFSEYIKKILGMFKNSEIMKYTSVHALTMGGITLYSLASAFIIIDHFKKSAVTYGWLQLATGGCGLLGAIAVKRLLRNLDVKEVLKLGIYCLCIFIILAIIVVTVPGFNNLTGLLFVIAVANVGTVNVATTGATLVMESGHHSKALTQGMLSLMRNSAITMAGFVTSTFCTTVDTLLVVMALVMGAVVLLCRPIWFYVSKPQ